MLRRLIPVLQSVLLPDIETMRQEIAAWKQDRNAILTGVNWRFTTADARIKLKRLYPSHQP